MATTQVCLSSAKSSSALGAGEQNPLLLIILSQNPVYMFLLLFNQHLAFQTKVQCPKARICQHFVQVLFKKGKERHLEQKGGDSSSIRKAAGFSLGHPSAKMRFAMLGDGLTTGFGYHGNVYLYSSLFFYLLFQKARKKNRLEVSHCSQERRWVQHQAVVQSRERFATGLTAWSQQKASR